MSKSGSRVLFVSLEQGQEPDEDADHFVIKDELNKMSQETFTELYSAFASWEIETSGGVPLYQIFWKWSATFERGVRLLHMVYLYRRLSDRIRVGKYEMIAYDGLDTKFESLVYDVADAEGIETRGSRFGYKLRATSRRVAALLRSFLTFTAFLMDQVVSILLRPIFGRPREIETALVPVRSQFDRMGPVVAELDEEYDIIVPTATVLWMREGSNYPDLTDHEPTPINTLSVPRDLIEETKLLAAGIWPEIAAGRLNDALHEIIEDEFEMGMPRCVSAEIDAWLANRSFTVSCLMYQLSQRILERHGCGSLVVGSAGPKGKAILAAGDHRDARLFHLRHSIVTGYTPDPPFDAVEFVEGSLAMSHLRSAKHVDDVSKFFPTGFQYLSDIYSERKDRYEPEEPVKVLIATQPYEDETRMDFLDSALSGISAMEADADVTIKIHPRESVDFYESNAPAGVSISQSNLEEHLYDADLALTINSNVGLEAMLIGTPCVCINEFEPMIQTMPYAEHGPVPVLQSGEEVREYFDGQTTDSLVTLYERQQAAVEDGFNLDQDASQRIAAHIMRGESAAAEPAADETCKNIHS